MAFDDVKFALEALSGGRNTLLTDNVGMPSVMVRIPRFRWCDVFEDGENVTCSAFIVGGEERDCVYISKYQNVIENGRAYSLPARRPAHTITVEEARQACARKGPGWHLMTNAEWAAIAHWCRKNGTPPGGNNHSGQNISAPHEHGIPAREKCVLKPGMVLTGSGPASWSHDGTPCGIFDLHGNLWDMVSGLRLVDGEIQVIRDNDSALNVDESAASPLWRAISPEGELVPPGTPGTYRYDGVETGSSAKKSAALPGGVVLSTRVEHPQYTGPERSGDYGYSMTLFETIGTAEGLPVSVRLKALGLYPCAPKLGQERFFLRSYGERMPLRGGSWLDKQHAGIWELYLRDTRAFLFPDVGFRAAYVEV